jgi:outer membrane protein OmpA-like peptidoglycan-associated protein
MAATLPKTRQGGTLGMKKLLIALLITATTGLTSGCMATRKFVRNEVKTSSDTLNSRIDTTDGQVKETRDQVDRVNERVTGVDGRVTQVDGRVSELDTKTTQGMTTLRTELKSDVTAVNNKADRTDSALSGLDQKFQNRNNFSIAAEKSIPFKFDSATLDGNYTADLDEIAEMVMRNPDSIVVLAGHTDGTGNQDYNVRLGERRVESVRRYLAVEKSVPVYRIHEISFGSAKPTASNDTRDGRAQNRNVSITVLAPATTSSTAAR